MTWRLALDTAGELGSVAVGNDHRPVASVLLPPRSHAKYLVPAIDMCLDMLGIAHEEIGEIVLADGPGSFTGLRIGVATVQGLIVARPREVWVAPSLMGLAWGASRGPDDVVAAIYDALRGEVFAAIYQFSSTNVTVHTEPRLVPAGDLQRCSEVRPTVVVGDGARAHPTVIGSWSGHEPGNRTRDLPRAEHLLRLVGLAGGARRVDDLAAFEPHYGRAAEAQVRWEQRHGRALPDPPA